MIEITFTKHLSKQAILNLRVRKQIVVGMLTTFKSTRKEPNLDLFCLGVQFKSKNLRVTQRGYNIDLGVR
jgi:hypothetical protein